MQDREARSTDVSQLTREELVARCYAPTRRALYAFSGSWDLAEEATQEAMARLWMKNPNTRGNDRPEAWAFVVGANYLRSRFRRARLERRYSQRRRPEAEATRTEATVVDREALIEALQALPLRQRRAVVLRHLLDVSVDDTAAEMGCASGTVRALTSQAMQTLRTHLGADTRPTTSEGLNDEH